MKYTVFISYSHADETWKDRLVTQLEALQLKCLDLWDDNRITFGQGFAQEIEKALKAASIAVLLISAKALASKFINREEIPPLLLRRKNEGLPIIPVIVSPCPWENVSWLAQMEILEWGAPLSEKTENDAEAALAEIAKQISTRIVLLCQS